MMYNLFECKVRYEKTMENGMNKKVTEPFLVNAFSFTEAEARIVKEMASSVVGEFTVVNITPVNYASITMDNDDCESRFYKVKVVYLTLDEKTGSEKKTSENVLVQACDIDTAKEILKADMQHLAAIYEIGGISETKIKGAFLYNTEDETN